MRILVVEDDAAVAQSLELLLRAENFNVTVATTGDEAIDFLILYEFDLCTLDLNLPDVSGFEVIRRVRSRKIETPIVILSGMCGIEDKVRAFGHGADDYMTKPFHKDELVARIVSIVRRSKGHAESLIVTGDLVVNLDERTASVCGNPVHLTGKEYAMLELLALRKGTTITKEQFLLHLYDGRDEPEIKIIDVFICKLRRKLDAASGGQEFVETIWGRGYVLRDPLPKVDSPSIVPAVDPDKGKFRQPGKYHPWRRQAKSA